MPLVSGPGQGYLDYQRTVNYDGPYFTDQRRNVVNGAPYTYPSVDCTRYAYLHGYIFVTSQPMAYQFEYCADQALTQIVGYKSFYVPTNASGYIPFHIPNLGAWCSTQAINQGGASAQVSVIWFPSNRPTDAILGQSGWPLVSTGTATWSSYTSYYPTTIWTGPVTITAEAPNNLCYVTVDWWNGIGWQRQNNIGTGGNSNVICNTINVPFGYCRYNTYNPTTAGSGTMQATAGVATA